MWSFFYSLTLSFDKFFSFRHSIVIFYRCDSTCVFLLDFNALSVCGQTKKKNSPTIRRVVRTQAGALSNDTYKKKNNNNKNTKISIITTTTGRYLYETITPPPPPPRTRANVFFSNDYFPEHNDRAQLHTQARARACLGDRACTIRRITRNVYRHVVCIFSRFPMDTRVRTYRVL